MAVSEGKPDEDKYDICGMKQHNVLASRSNQAADLIKLCPSKADTFKGDGHSRKLSLLVFAYMYSK